MDTIKVAYKSDVYGNSPDDLVLIGTLGDIEAIENFAQRYKESKLYEQTFSVSIKTQLYDIPENFNWRYDVDKLTLYFNDTGDLSGVYQYMQSKYDSSDQIETGDIDLQELKKHLKQV